MAGERGKRGKRRRRRGGPDNPAQSKRFIEAARKLGLSENGEAFSRALDKIAPKKHKGNGSN